MAEFINPVIETNPAELVEEGYDYLQTNVPGWEPSDGNLDDILLNIKAAWEAETRDVASDVPLSIFRFFGNSVMNIPPEDAATASVDSTWTMIDNAGYTIPAGTVVGIPAAGDVLVGFAVAEEVVVAPGATVTDAGAVQLVAIEPGTVGNGLSSGAQLIDSLDYVSNIVLVGSTSGGVDAEEDEAYLDRLTTELQLNSPRPIIPRDFEVLARRIAGVVRSTAIDGYNPGDSTFNNERMVTVAVADGNGENLSAPVKSAVDAYLEALREVNFIVHVIDPTANTVDITYAGKARLGFDPATVEASVDEALADYLSKANWGLPPEGTQEGWVNVTKVRRLEVASVINDVPGFDYLTTLTIGINGAGQTTAEEHTMTGAAPLPVLSSVAGTVTA